MRFPAYMGLAAAIIGLVVLSWAIYTDAPEDEFSTAWEQLIHLRNAEDTVLEEITAELEQHGWESRWWAGEKFSRFKRDSIGGIPYAIACGDETPASWPETREAMIVVVIDTDGEAGGPSTSLHRCIYFEAAPPLPARAFVAGRLRFPGVELYELDRTGVLGDMIRRLRNAAARIDEMLMHYALEEDAVRSLLVESGGHPGTASRLLSEMLIFGDESISARYREAAGSDEETGGAVLAAHRLARAAARAWNDRDRRKLEEAIAVLKERYPRSWRYLLGMKGDEIPTLALADLQDAADDTHGDEAPAPEKNAVPAALAEAPAESGMSEEMQRREAEERAEIAAFLGYGTPRREGTGRTGQAGQAGRRRSIYGRGFKPKAGASAGGSRRTDAGADLSGDGKITFKDFVVIKMLSNDPGYGNEDLRIQADLNDDDTFDQRDIIYMYWKIECRGDMDGDGEMSDYDVDLLNEFITDYLDTEEDRRPPDITAYDVDCNGELTRTDAQMLRRKLSIVHKGGGF